MKKKMKVIRIYIVGLLIASPIYDLVIQPLAGEACGYWANGILVGGE